MARQFRQEYPFMANRTLFAPSAADMDVRRIGALRDDARPLDGRHAQSYIQSSSYGKQGRAGYYAGTRWRMLSPVG
jgi:hypothetical protein